MKFKPLTKLQEWFLWFYGALLIVASLDHLFNTYVEDLHRVYQVAIEFGRSLGSM